MKLSRFACILLIVLTSTAVGVILPETAGFLPDSTIVLINVNDFSECREQFKKTSLYGLYTDPSMKEFVTETERRFKEYLQSVEDETVRTIVAADALPSGRLVFAFILPREGSPVGEDPTMLFISQWGEKTDAVKGAVEKMVEKSIEEGAKRSTEDYRGVNIATIKSVRKSVDTDDPNGPEQNKEQVDELSYCFVDDVLIVAEETGSIEFIVAHIKGSSGGTLAENSGYVSAMQAVGPYHDIDIYINVKKLLAEIAADDPSGSGLIKSLGMDNVDSYASSLGIARQRGSNYFGKAIVKVDGDKRGIMKMLDFVSSQCKGPKFISARASSVAFINLDLNKTYDELFRILSQFQPMLAGSLNAPITPPTADGKAGLTLKEGVLNHLDSQITISESIDESPVEEGSVNTKILGSISVKNSAKLEETLSLLHSMMAGPEAADAKREFMGRTIYLIKIPGLTSPPGQMLLSDETEIKGGLMFGSGSGVPAFTVTETEVLIGDESAVEQAIRLLNDSSSDTISSADWFRRAQALVPRMAGVASFSNVAVQAEQLWKMFKSEFAQVDQTEASVSAGMMMFDINDPGFEKLKKIVDVSSLPEFESVRKYFGVSAFYGISRPDGFYFEFRDLNEAGLNPAQ